MKHFAVTSFSDLRAATSACTFTENSMAAETCTVVINSNLVFKSTIYINGNFTRISFEGGLVFPALNGNGRRHFVVESGARVNFTRLSFENGRASIAFTEYEGNGGSVWVKPYTFSRFSFCAFRRNQAARRGGALYVEGDVYEIESSTFEENVAQTSGGAIAIAGETGFVRLIRADTQFDGNVASQNDGGAIFTVEGGAIGSIDRCSFRDNKILTTNRFVGGSAIAFNTGRYELSTVISNVEFINNGPAFAIIKRGSYGRVYILQSSPLLAKDSENGCGFAEAPPGSAVASNWEQILNEKFYDQANERDEINSTVWNNILFAPCPQNTFIQREGIPDSTINLPTMASCITCPDGTSATKGSTVCIPCTGFYLLSKHCDVMVLGYLILFLVGSTIAFLVMFIVSNRRRYKEMLERKQEELLTNMDQVRILRDTWRINDKDVTFGKKVAHGGYGVVWRGKWLQYEVAIKELFPLPSMCEDDDEFDDAEVQSMLSLRHPRIVHFHGVGRRTLTNNRRFLIFEWMSGGSLYHTLLRKQYPLPWWWRLRCAIDIAVAVEFLHRSGFAHRDLKSENILLDSMGRCKVGDFGMTRMTHKELHKEGLRPEQATRVRVNSTIDKFRAAVRKASTAIRAFELPRIRRKLNKEHDAENNINVVSTDLSVHPASPTDKPVHTPRNAPPNPPVAKMPANGSSSGSGSTLGSGSGKCINSTLGEATLVQGTTRYMAPELYGTMHATPTYAADVYAYGMILYELLTRHLPWKKEMEKQAEFDPWKEASLGSRPKLEYAKISGMPFGFRALIQKCWSQNPEDRPSMHTVLIVLNDMADDRRDETGEGGAGSGAFALPQNILKLRRKSSHDRIAEYLGLSDSARTSRPNSLELSSTKRSVFGFKFGWKEV